jgi:hypothetical protein
MRKISTILFYLFFWSMINAQDQKCDVSVVMNVKGKWVIGDDNIVSPEKTFPRSQYNQLNTRIDKIAAMFQQAYPQPMGTEAKWYRSIRGNALVKNGPVPYQFNSLYKGWYCNQNLHKLMLGTETGTWAFVWVNTFGWFMTDQFDKTGITIEGADAYLLPKKIGEWKGAPCFDHSGNANEKVVLITRNNQLPYKPVSRLQFLQWMKNKVEGEKKMQIEVDKKQPIRTGAEEETSKQKELENIVKTNRPERVEQRKADYLKNYKTDAQRKEETIARTEKYYSERIKPINDALNIGDKDELQKPAIVDKNYYSFFKTFTTEEKGGRVMVFINNDYFDLRLPRYVPQLIVLYWSWDKNGAALNFNKALEENFPLNKLKEMIDK